MNARRLLPLITIVLLTVMALAAQNRRHVTPVNTAATRTQHVNDAKGDSARALERRRARSVHYHDENGNTIMVDTVTGQEWVDSTLMPPPPPMKYPLLYTIEAGVNIGDVIMRAFGQKYGLLDFSVALNMHNRYLPTFEFGLGTAKRKSDKFTFTYRTPTAPYFKIGADYNFLYNSNPDYKFLAGVRYGFSAFRYSVTGITVGSSYWDETSVFDIPSTSATAGWFEVSLGLRVRLIKELSAGWTVKYHSILHQSHPAAGDPWYIPGFGSSSSALSVAVNVTWTIPFGTGSSKKAVETPVIDLSTEQQP